MVGCTALSIIMKKPQRSVLEERVSDLPLVGNMRGHPGDEYAAVDVEAGVRPGENALEG